MYVVHWCPNITALGKEFLGNSKVKEEKASNCGLAGAMTPLEEKKATPSPNTLLPGAFTFCIVRTST